VSLIVHLVKLGLQICVKGFKLVSHFLGLSLVYTHLLHLIEQPHILVSQQLHLFAQILHLDLGVDYVTLVGLLKVC
jgi:hypothetical protein